MTMSCIVCEDFRLHNFMGGLKKCAGCGLVSADTEITDKGIKEIYEKDYFFGRCYVDYIREKKALQLNFRGRLRELLRHVDIPAQKSLFEIGCAYGFFLDLAKKEFRTVGGIDITEDGCMYAKKELGLDVVCGDFLKFDIGRGRYDIFCLWDTIEHLAKPHLYLEKISNSLNKGGIISLTTGDIGSLSARLSRNKWRLIHPPEHLFYFSRRTISGLLKKYGFEVISIKYCGMHRTLKSAFLGHQGSFIYRWLKKSRLSEALFYVNLFDIMQVTARKKTG